MQTRVIHPPVTADPVKIAELAHIADWQMEEFLPICEKAASLADPVALVGIGTFLAKDDAVFSVGGVEFQSRHVVSRIENGSTVFPYVLTSGKKLYEAYMAEEDPLYQFWMELTAQVTLGAALPKLFDDLAAEYQTGSLFAVNPGSLADWPLPQQKPLFALLQKVEEQIGVRLTDSFLMLPNKTVSGIAFHSEDHYTNCRYCPRRDCENRREPNDLH